MGCLIVKMGALHGFETSVTIYLSTRSNIPEDLTLHLVCFQKTVKTVNQHTTNHVFCIVNISLLLNQLASNIQGVTGGTDQTSGGCSLC